MHGQRSSPEPLRTREHLEWKPSQVKDSRSYYFLISPLSMQINAILLHKLPYLHLDSKSKMCKKVYFTHPLSASVEVQAVLLVIQLQQGMAYVLGSLLLRGEKEAAPGSWEWPLEGANQPMENVCPLLTLTFQ